MKLRNPSVTARAITRGRLEKLGWIESDNNYKPFIKYQKSSTLTFGDSIAKGLVAT